MSSLDEPLWTISDVAEFTKVTPNTVYQWIYKNKIPYLRFGRTIRFDPKALREWIEQSRNASEETLSAAG